MRAASSISWACIAATTALVIGIVVDHGLALRHRADPCRSPVCRRNRRRESCRPAPHLQINPFADLAQQQARESRLLHSYGWTSADHSTARIPIDRAMALTRGKSLDAPP